MFRLLAEEIHSMSPPPGTPGFEAGMTSLNCSQCLPTCHETKYLVDVDMHEVKTPLRPGTGGYLDIYYKDLAAVKYRRDVAFGRMQLVVSFGGIAGLFLGVSILSAVELVYYCLKMLSVIFTCLIWNKLIDLCKRYRQGSPSNYHQKGTSENDKIPEILHLKSRDSDTSVTQVSSTGRQANLSTLFITFLNIDSQSVCCSLVSDPRLETQY
uniref:Uncharacterized protein n=1 Tax=Timema monikensis TaxID=170555 RepID=A0A7R9EAN3_9NEOP|nr:unnamed protein product [Timema monikensis]